MFLTYPSIKYRNNCFFQSVAGIGRYVIIFLGTHRKNSYYCITRFFISNTVVSNARLKQAKN